MLELIIFYLLVSVIVYTIAKSWQVSFLWPVSFFKFIFEKSASLITRIKNRKSIKAF